MAAAEVLAVLCDKLPVKVPPTELVEKCRDLYVQVWDVGIEKLSTRGNYKDERRAVIVSTFKRLLKVCRRRNVH